MSAQVVMVLLGAVLVFWVVGAYNRIVRLRSAVVAAFVPVDARLCERQALLDRLIALLDSVLASAAAARLEALRAAFRQADAARVHASARPGAPGATTSLRVAEDILADARSRLPPPAAPASELPALQAQLAEADRAATFARREFNTAVAFYNDAVRQFPTIIVARLFGFRAAGPF